LKMPENLRRPRKRGERGRYRHGADHDAGVFKERWRHERLLDTQAAGNGRWLGSLPRIV